MVRQLLQSVGLTKKSKVKEPSLRAKTIRIMNELRDDISKQQEKLDQLNYFVEKYMADPDDYLKACWEAADMDRKMAYLRFMRKELGLPTDIEESVLETGFDIECYAAFDNASKEHQGDIRTKAYVFWGILG